MGLATLIFLCVGGFSLVMLALSVFGSHLHLGHGDIDSSITLPGLAGFVGAFGFAGAIAAELTPGHALDGLVGAGVGILAAVPVGYGATRLTRAAQRMGTDSTPTSDALVGSVGVILTATRSGGYGEVRLTMAGQSMKFNARSEEPLAAGTSVLVIGTVSPSCVLVQPTPQFFQKDGQ
ncbi:hypothetical protein AB0M43_29825 [Longispora sp. NPDC051575]|uniref:hypothetical protein n=1 Tax=Longispora sp. NPDC051575 TaxID=3154943 RepID=UPI0034459642